MRAGIACFVLLASLGNAGPSRASGMDRETADAATAEFRESHGDDVSISFQPDRTGAAFLGRFRTEPLAGDPVEAAWRFLEGEAAILGLSDPRASLRVDRVRTWRGWTMVRFRQVAYGLPVIGRGFVVVADDEGRVYQAAGGTADLRPLVDGPVLGADEAAAALLERSPGVKVKAIEPAILAVGDGAAFVHVVTVHGQGFLDRYEVVVDARTARPILVRPLVLAARGYVYDPSPTVSPTYTEVDLLNLESATNLVGTYGRTYACSGSRCSSLIQRAAADGAGNYYYLPDDASPDDEFAEVQGYYHTDAINRFFAETLDYSWTCDGSHSFMSVVNYDMGELNAYYGDIDDDGCGDAVMGQGSVVDEVYDAGSVYHEFTHGIVDDTAGLWGWGADELGPDFSSGGLNEGTADYFSVTNTEHPLIGDYTAREGPAYALVVRNAVNDLTCPQNLTGESHYDGRILLGTSWEIRTAIGAAKADAVVFATLLALSETASFDEAGRGLISAADRLATEGLLTAEDAAEVERIATERGLPGCVRIVDLYDPETGESLTGKAFSYGIEEIGGWIDELASGIQFRIRSPDTAVRVTLEIDPAVEVVPDAYDVYMRIGEPCHFTFSGRRLELDAYDRVWTGNPGGITFATWTDPPITPGVDYYFTFMHRNPWSILLGFRASVSTGTPRPDDAGEWDEDVVEAVEDVPVTPETGDEATAPDVPAEAVDDVVAPDVAPDVVVDDVVDAVDGEPDGLPPIVTTGGGCGCGLVAAAPSSLLVLCGALLGLALRRRRG
jgi:Zn-dependent metalloprotease